MHVIAHVGISQLLEHCVNELKMDINVPQEETLDQPLHVAARAGHFRTVRTLLKLGADVSALNHKNEKPIDVVNTTKGHGCKRMLSKAMDPTTVVTSTHRQRRRREHTTKQFEMTEDIQKRFDTCEQRQFEVLSKETKKSLRIVSYNVLAQAYTRPNFFPWTTDLSFESRFKRICQTLTNLNADVYALQEVDHPLEFEAYFKKRGFDFYFKKRTGERKDGCALATKSQLLQSIESIEFNDFVPSHLRSQNIIAQVAKLSNGLTITNTHLYYKSADLRYADVNTLMKKVEGPVVMCGDFNFASTSKEYAAMTNMMKDAYESSNAAFPYTVFASATKSGRRIDHLFYSDQLTLTSRLALPSKNTLLPNKMNGSDHLPIAIEVIV